FSLLPSAFRRICCKFARHHEPHSPHGHTACKPLVPEYAGGLHADSHQGIREVQSEHLDRYTAIHSKIHRFPTPLLEPGLSALWIHFAVHLKTPFAKSWLTWSRSP